jgi:hypothetical protein
VKRLIAILSAVILVSLVASPAAAVLDNGTGHYWLFEGANQSGEYRDFNIGPSQTVNLTGLYFQQNCGGSCTPMNNRVSSVAFSCGISGSAIDQSDWLTFYDIYPNVGTHQLVDPNYPGACVNGLIRINLTTANNLASSVITHE